MSEKPTLYLFPTPLGDAPAALSAEAVQVISRLTDFVAESAKCCRRFLKAYPLAKPLQEISICELNEHTASSVIPDLCRPLKEGRSVGLVSDAGCPGVADPGAALVLYAHQHGIKVVPFAGPSSLLLSLMASGLDGQRFSFYGYLPTDERERHQAVKTLENTSAKQHMTQIFIETPYRNDQLLQTLLAACAPSTLLCVAADLMQPSEYIYTATIEQWRKKKPLSFNKRPAVFLMLAASDIKGQKHTKAIPLK